MKALLVLARRIALIALVYAWVDIIGKKVKTSADNMISQLSESLPKFVYVGLDSSIMKRYVLVFLINNLMKPNVNILIFSWFFSAIGNSASSIIGNISVEITPVFLTNAPFW